MRIIFPILSLAISCMSFELTLKRLDAWESASKSKKVFSFNESSKLSSPIHLNDGCLVEVELSSSKPNPAQISVFLSPLSNEVADLESFPSVHFPLLSTGSSTYRTVLGFKAGRGLSARGGLYSISVIIAGESITPLKVSVGTAQVRESTDGALVPDFHTLPVISHQFRAPHETADPLISRIFTGLVVTAPAVIFLGGLFRLDLNMKGISSVYSSLFFAGMLVYGALMTAFFLALNLVQTVAGGIVIVIPMTFVGHKVLSQLRTVGDIS